jgi:hypothetical protein
MVNIYLKNGHLPSRNHQVFSGKGVPLLLNSVIRNPIVGNEVMSGSGILTKSNVVGGILANHPKVNPAPPSKQELTPLPTGGGSLLERVSIPLNKKQKKENRNNIKLVL